MTADKASQQRPSPFERKPNPMVTRMLRKKATNAERLLWSLLRNRQCGGFKFRRQYQVGIYVLDFYCHEARLGVELDGGQHGEPVASKNDE